MIDPTKRKRKFTTVSDTAKLDDLLAELEQHMRSVGLNRPMIRMALLDMAWQQEQREMEVRFYGRRPTAEPPPTEPLWHVSLEDRQKEGCEPYVGHAPTLIGALFAAREKLDEAMANRPAEQKPILLGSATTSGDLLVSDGGRWTQAQPKRVIGQAWVPDFREEKTTACYTTGHHDATCFIALTRDVFDDLRIGWFVHIDLPLTKGSEILCLPEGGAFKDGLRAVVGEFEGKWKAWTLRRV